MSIFKRIIQGVRYPSGSKIRATQESILLFVHTGGISNVENEKQSNEGFQFKPRIFWKLSSKLKSKDCTFSTVNNSLPQDVNVDNFVKQELDDTLLKHNREDLSETRNNSIAQDISSGNSGPYYIAPLDLVKQELDDIVEKDELNIREEISTEFQSDISDIKLFKNQITEEYTKIWHRGYFAETWNKFSIKCEENEDSVATNGCTANKNSELQAENELIEQKIEKVKCHSDCIPENHQTEDYKCEYIKRSTDNADHMSNDTFASEGNTLLNHGSRECSPHMSDDSNQLKQTIHKCHVCDFRANQISNLKNHMDTVHLKDKTCPFCDYYASRKWLLKQHINSVHLKVKNFKCHICDYGASRKNYLQVHINTVHLKLKSHKCHLCEYSASQKGQLNTHLKSVHLNLKKRKCYMYKCHMCEYNVSKKSLLKNHMNAVHLNLKTHKCTMCDYKAHHRNRLQDHINNVHAQRKNYKCHSCDYSATQNNLLQRHVNAVHLKLKNHKCQWCHFSASLKINLQVHINAVHLKLKNHNCQWCDYSASLKSTLQEHINAVHLKLMNRKCHLCKFVTSRRSALRRHIDTVHLCPQK